MKKICVIGQGYIGIPTAMVLAEQGFDVIGVDKDNRKIELLNQKKLPFHEKEFSEFSKKIFESGCYSASSEVPKADVYIICVPTPFSFDKKCDYRYVISATESIVPVLGKKNLVILESTVPPMTCQDIIIPILEKSNLKAKEDFFVSHAPERLLPGNILYEIINNDRIIGGIDKKSTQMTYEIYKTFSKGNIILTDAESAEMSKLMENTFRDVNIALANEFALICESLNINPYECIKMANKHPRVNILEPGPGVGGHCIPIDPWFIVEKNPSLSKLIKQARLINDNMPDHVVDDVIKILKNIDKPKVTILGLAYKPNVDDPRESPTKYIIKKLEEKKIVFKLHDPLIKSEKFNLVSLNEAVKDSDCVIYVVNHEIFKSINIKEISKLMRNRNIYACGNFISINDWKDNGFKIKILGLSNI